MHANLPKSNKMATTGYGNNSPKMAPVLQSVSPSLRGMMTKSPQPEIKNSQLEYMQMPDWEILMLADLDQQKQPQNVLPQPQQDAMMLLPPPQDQSTHTATAHTATRTVPKLVWDVRTITVSL